ncbi:MAG: hypothetical protein GC136_01455 [Alphaproteobacteria bacterium]|nr:hypothetical protein [Alphaproteobacteria bacterium]
MFEPLSRFEELEEEIIFILLHHISFPEGTDLRALYYSITPESRFSTIFGAIDKNSDDIYTVFKTVLECQFDIKLEGLNKENFGTVRDATNMVFPLLPEQQRPAYTKKKEEYVYVPQGLGGEFVEWIRQRIERMGYKRLGIDPDTLQPRNKSRKGLSALWGIIGGAAAPTSHAEQRKLADPSAPAP